MEKLLKKLRLLEPEITASYKARNIGIFGSFVRDEPKEESDVDILVEFEQGADLFDWIGLALFLEDELDRKVDVVPKSALRTELRESVLQEVVYL
ncbi:MAG: nucleotidyltransferase family protein [Chloroflexi bacterium]|nr:nucleotidyltransferase family protein [Chloroflexota bacterium]